MVSFKKILRFVCFGLCLTLASCSLFNYVEFVDEYDLETDESAMERIRDWGIDLPENSSVITRKLSRNPGWDGGFDGLYYVFKIEENFYFESNIDTTDYESFSTKLNDLYEPNHWLESETIKPNFDEDMSCCIAVRLKKTNNFINDDSSEISVAEYTHRYLTEDEYFIRRQPVGEWIFVAKGYFILQTPQPNLTYLFVNLTIDSSEKQVFRLEKGSNDSFDHQ